MTKPRHQCNNPESCPKCIHAKELREWRIRNKDKIKKYQDEYNKKYYELNQEKIKAQVSEYFYSGGNRDYLNQKKRENYTRRKTHYQNKSKEWHWTHREEHIQKMRDHYNSNAKEIRKKQYQYKRKKYYSDPLYRLNECIAANLRSTFKYTNNKKNNRTSYYTGCSVKFLKDYLAKLFLPSMSWDNFGRGGWVVDHIIPRVTFASDDVSQRKCWHYTNLRPMWEKDNLSKGVSQTYISQAELEVLMCMF